MLKQMVTLINQSDVGCISIACNTAHILLPELKKISKAPFVSMIDEVAEQAYKDGITKVGLLGTPSTVKYGLYQNAFSRYRISTEIPSTEQIKIMERIIRNVLGGKMLEDNTKQLKKIADDLRIKGAEGIILGCTELPLIFPKKYSSPIYNSVEILAMALLRRYYAKP